jgi:hypothetical protein
MYGPDDYLPPMIRFWSELGCTSHRDFGRPGKFNCGPIEFAMEAVGLPWAALAGCSSSLLAEAVTLALYQYFWG